VSASFASDIYRETCSLDLTHDIVNSKHNEKKYQSFYCIFKRPSLQV